MYRYRIRIILLQYVLICTKYRENIYDIHFHARIYNSLNRMIEVSDVAHISSSLVVSQDLVL